MAGGVQDARGQGGAQPGGLVRPVELVAPSREPGGHLVEQVDVALSGGLRQRLGDGAAGRIGDDGSLVLTCNPDTGVTK